MQFLWSITAINVKIFVPNTNYGNLKNWKEHQIPCDKSHVIFPTRTPKIFLNGSSLIYHISEMNLPYNGELLFDNAISLSVADLSRETDCDTIVAHYNKVEPDFWYNPDNWCQSSSLTSPCLKKPQVEAAIVPCSSDTVVFNRGNTFLVGVKPNEAKIVAKEIFLRGILFRNTFLFRQKIRRTSKSNIVEFVNINSTYPPIIELKGNKAANQINSNLERMPYICQYVTCRPTASCTGHITPTGSCCQLCAKKFSVKLLSFSGMPKFAKWFDDLIDDYYKTAVMYNMLMVRKFTFEIVISSLNIDSDIPDVMATEIVEKILSDKMLIGVDLVDELSWVMKAHKQTSHHLALIIILIIASVLVLIAFFLAIRRRNTLSIFLSAHAINILPKCPTIKLPSINIQQFRAKFPRTRLKEERDSVVLPGSMFPSISGAVEVIELPEKVIDVSFDNPIYDSEMVFEDSHQ